MTGLSIAYANAMATLKRPNLMNGTEAWRHCRPPCERERYHNRERERKEFLKQKKQFHGSAQESTIIFVRVI